MAPLHHTKVLFLYLLFAIFSASRFISVTSQNGPQRFEVSGRKRVLLLDIEDELDQEEAIIKKKITKISTKNLTKLVKPTSISPKNQTKIAKTAATVGGLLKNQTKIIKFPYDSSKNKTKIIKTGLDSIKDSVPSLKSQFKKLNSTSKSSSNSTTKSSDLLKLGSPKNKTVKLVAAKDPKSQLGNTVTLPISKSPDKIQTNKAQKQPKPTSIVQEDEDDDDLVSEFRDLPSKFQESFVPDLEKISKTSQVYLSKYNKEFTKGFKPYVGNKYASTIASIISFAFIVIPLILVSLIFNRIKAYFSLQKLLIFIQVYLAIYFTILCLSSLVTGLEPLKFFYTTSQSTYVCVQVLQTLGYVLYLLLLLMYLILVFSTETGLATKILSLAQTFVGFAVGLHYYMTVFHRAILRQPPKTSWKVHSLYAACFLVICLLGRVDRQKKAYLEDGGEEGKKS